MTPKWYNKLWRWAKTVGRHVFVGRPEGGDGRVGGVKWKF
jgi:hypothetical protein